MMMLLTVAGNEAPRSSMCLTQDAMLPYVLPPHEGWEYVDEGKEGKPKKGFVATKPGEAKIVKWSAGGHFCVDLSHLPYCRE